METTPTVGRIVMFKIAENELRPAIIVKVWDANSGACNLQVFLDGQNDLTFNTKEAGRVIEFEDANKGITWKTSVVPGEGIGQWSWPVRK